MNLFRRIERSAARRDLISSFRRWRFRLLTDGLQLGKDVRIGKRVTLETWRSLPGKSFLSIGDQVELGDGVRLESWKGSITIAGNTYLGPDTKVYGHGGVSIGADTLIAMNCCILSSEHAVPPIGTPIRSMDDIRKPTRIGNDVWIGAGVTVLGGVTIGDGAIVGAGAVVSKDLPPNTVCIGSPAKPIRSRESDA